MSVFSFASTVMQEGIGFDAAEDKSTYRLMLTIRRFEEKLGQLVALGVVPNCAPLSTGKEAIAAAIALSADAREPLICATGVHAALLARGASLEEILGRLIEGDRLADYAMSLGVTTSQSGAAALRAALKAAASSASFCWFEAGQEESHQMRALLQRVGERRLPIVCLVDTPLQSVDSSPEPEEMVLEAHLLGIPVECVDGTEVRMVAAACRKGADGARRGQGPSLIAVRTVRFQGHVASDAGAGRLKTRPREETDPIARARASLLMDGAASETELKALEKEVREAVNAVAVAARAAAENLRDAD